MSSKCFFHTSNFSNNRTLAQIACLKRQLRHCVSVESKDESMLFQVGNPYFLKLCIFYLSIISITNLPKWIVLYFIYCVCLKSIRPIFLETPAMSSLHRVLHFLPNIWHEWLGESREWKGSAACDGTVYQCSANIHLPFLCLDDVMKIFWSVDYIGCKLVNIKGNAQT